jgi:uncharacterized membrane protein YfcA
LGAGAIAAFLWSIPIAAAGGLIGLGGAEFRLPVLVSVLHHTARQAVPLNLAVSLATILFSLVGRAGTLPSVMPLSSDLVPLALGSGGAAFFGAGWGRQLSEVQLRRVIFILLVAIGSALVIEAFVPIAGPGFLPHDAVIRASAGLLFGMGIGLVSSLLGVAGGEVIIPTLVFAFGVDIKIAGTASLLVSLPTVVIGIARNARLRAYDDRVALRSTVAPMSLGSAVGAIAGGLALGLVSPMLLKIGLGTILIWSAWRIFRHGR